MGLDTDYDCWSGPYSAFMRWRCNLNYWILKMRGVENHDGTTRKALEDAWGRGEYADQSVPINVLMNHSDCDGEIPAEVCAPLADALQEILDRIPRRAMYDPERPATERFIAGLRQAAEDGESVGFH